MTWTVFADGDDFKFSFSVNGVIKREEREKLPIGHGQAVMGWPCGQEKCSRHPRDSSQSAREKSGFSAAGHSRSSPRADPCPTGVIRLSARRTRGRNFAAKTRPHTAHKHALLMVFFLTAKSPRRDAGVFAERYHWKTMDVPPFNAPDRESGVFSWAQMVEDGEDIERRRREDQNQH